MFHLYSSEMYCDINTIAVLGRAHCRSHPNHDFEELCQCHPAIPVRATRCGAALRPPAGLEGLRGVDLNGRHDAGHELEENEKVLVHS